MTTMTQPDFADITGAVAQLAASSNLEVIPLKGAEAKVLAALPGSTITITCSPKFGLTRTLEHVDSAIKAGYRVVPHLAARMVADEVALRDFVNRVTDLGVTDLYVIGGDGSDPVGKYHEASEILEDVRSWDTSLTRLGVGCYPEGHPNIADEALQDALIRKQQLADYMVSQLCFDAAAFLRWLKATREAGVTLPLRIGLAAPISVPKLAELSLRIGVGNSLKYLRKQHGMIGNFVLGRSYQPETFLEDIASELSDPTLAIEGVHLFTFNQVDASVAWQERVGGLPPLRA